MSNGGWLCVTLYGARKKRIARARTAARATNHIQCMMRCKQFPGLMSKVCVESPILASYFKPTPLSPFILFVLVEVEAEKQTSLSRLHIFCQNTHARNCNSRRWRPFAMQMMKDTLKYGRIVTLEYCLVAEFDWFEDAHCLVAFGFLRFTAISGRSSPNALPASISLISHSDPPIPAELSRCAASRTAASQNVRGCCSMLSSTLPLLLASALLRNDPHEVAAYLDKHHSGHYRGSQ